MPIQDVASGIPFAGCYVQRFSSTFGINSSPTTVELTLVPGDPNSQHDINGDSTGGIPVTGFNPDVCPGYITGIEIGAFKFVGIITQDEENFGTAGKTNTVRISDPRVLFDNVQIVLDSRLNIDHDYIALSGLSNYLDVFHYYTDNVEADKNAIGISYRKVRDFLSNSGYINLYGRPCTLSFSSGFLDYASGINEDGIPIWYRLPAASLSLSALLNKVSEDFNKDYYAHIDYDSWILDPTGMLVVNINHINRNEANDLSGINTIISGAINDGVMISYKRGRELRTDPVTTAMVGPQLTYWSTPNHASSEIRRFWGFTHYGIALTTAHNSNQGIVLLDHIVGKKSSNIASTVNVVGKIYQKSANSTGIYPPLITSVTINTNISGYLASDTLLRASLYSKEAWESVLFKENETFAKQIGIPRQRFRTGPEYDDLIDSLAVTGVPFGRLGITLSIIGSGITDRDDQTEALISAVYEATKSVSEQHYGKSWLVKLDSSNWIKQETFEGTELFPTIEFEIADAAWSQGFGGGAYPYNITNHELLHQYNNPLFKDSFGRIRAFVSLVDYNDLTDGYIVGDFPYSIDTSNISPDQMFIEQGDKLVLPISVTHYNLYPASGIVELPIPIEGLVSTSGYDDKVAFYQFLKYMEYTDDQIEEYLLLDKVDDNSAFGLAPPRLPYILSVQENYGIHIPLQSNVSKYGPFISSGSVPGGLQLIEDDNLAPWIYGSVTGLNEAGKQSVISSNNTIHKVISADLSLAGLPDYNIGDNIGDTSNITALSLQLGTDGLITNYTVRTFVLPPFKTTKMLQDKIGSILLQTQKNTKELVDLDKVKDTDEKPSTQYVRPSQINPKQKIKDKNRVEPPLQWFLGNMFPDASGGLIIL